MPAWVIAKVNEYARDNTLTLSLSTKDRRMLLIVLLSEKISRWPVLKVKKLDRACEFFFLVAYDSCTVECSCHRTDAEEAKRQATREKFERKEG